MNLSQLHKGHMGAVRLLLAELKEGDLIVTVRRRCGQAVGDVATRYK